jgi:5'-nucleotidase
MKTKKTSHQTHFIELNKRTMNRKKFIQKGALLSGLIVSNSLPIDAFGKNESNEKELTILHTNDVHSRLDPFPMDGSKYQGMGGVANRKKAIDAFHKANTNVLLLDSGDMFQGTPYFNMYKGEPEIKVMSALGYDAATLGNHDFDAGMDNLLLQLQHANFPIINCNYDFSETVLEQKIKPYTIIKKRDVKIGIIGVGILLKGLVPDHLFGLTKYLDPVEKANYYAYFLKIKKHCDIVICLSHLGYDYEGNKIDDKKLAKQSEHIDIILGGHTHTFLDQPFIAKNKVNKEVIINQVGWAGIQLGCLEIDFYTQKKEQTLLKSHTGIFIKKTSV